ncbi:MAG: MEKHLA domain-containing protein [Novosphingobium sp.]
MRTSDISVPARYREAATARAIAAIAASFEQLLGRALTERGDDPIAALWHAPAVIVTHGTEPDPRFFFGNRAALDAFEYPLDRFIGMPSRLTAEAPVRDERRALLARVTAEGFIADYAGIRVTATGRRFRIERAIVWNVTDPAGVPIGQAATFTL